MPLQNLGSAASFARATRQSGEGKGTARRLLGDVYAIVETARGQAVYVPIDAASAESTAEGAIVRVAAEGQTWSKPMDLSRSSPRENGGIEDANACLQALERRQQVIGSKTTHAEEALPGTVVVSLAGAASERTS